MKKITLIFLIFSLSTLLFSGFGCKEEKEEVKTEKDCGCEATLIDYTIPDDEPMAGGLCFAEKVRQDTTGEFRAKYGIFVSKGNGDFRDSFFICNDDLIPANLRKENIQDSVYFSGKVIKSCQEFRGLGPGNHTYYHIELTKIYKK